MKTIKPNDGVEMLMAGFGAFQGTENECKDVVLNGVRAGYRLIGTASSYKNENAVGKAIHEALQTELAGKNEGLDSGTRLWQA